MSESIGGYRLNCAPARDSSRHIVNLNESLDMFFIHLISLDYFFQDDGSDGTVYPETISGKETFSTRSIHLIDRKAQAFTQNQAGLTDNMSAFRVRDSGFRIQESWAEFISQFRM